MVKNRLKSSDLKTERPLRAVDGSDLQVRPLGAHVRVGEATITRPDIVAKNGVIHGIDRVVIEPQMMAQRQKSPPLFPGGTPGAKNQYTITAVSPLFFQE